MSDVYLGAIAVVSVLALAAILVAAGLDGQPPHRRRRRGPAASRSVAVGTVQAVADSENPLVVVEVESVNGQRFTGRLCHRQGDPAVAALRPGLILLVSFDPQDRDRLSLADDVVARVNGKDITAQYKVSNPASQGEVTDTAQSPEDWMKKLLSSEDSGVKMPGDDPVIEMAMTMFTSLMALALQIDNKSEEEKMQKVTDSVVSKSIDLSSLLPSYKACSVNIQDGKPYLHVDNGTIQFTREMTQAEMTKLQQTLSNADLSNDDKRRGVASIIQAATVSQQMSQNYQKGVDNQQDRQESVQIK